VFATANKSWYLSNVWETSQYPCNTVILLLVFIQTV